MAGIALRLALPFLVRERGAEPYDPKSTANDHPDAIEDLGDEIAALAAQIDAANHRLDLLITALDEHRDRERGGRFSSPLAGGPPSRRAPRRG